MSGIATRRVLLVPVAAVLAGSLLVLAAPEPGPLRDIEGGVAARLAVAREAVRPRIPRGAAYVSPAGDDSNDGSRSRPWRTLQKAAATVRPGGTVLVRSGTYAGFVLTASGSPGAPIRFAGFPGERLPIVAGGEDDEVISLSKVRHVVLSRMTVQGAPEQFGAGVRVDESAHVTVSEMLLRGNRSFGVKVKDSTDVAIRGNAITRNETGIEISGGGRVAISANRIFDNDRMVVNDPEPGNDRGANGIVLHRTAGPVRISGNRVWGNRARSIDYGYDGGAFEIFASSNLSITGNRVWNNQNVIETGTRERVPCHNNRFVRNVAYGGRRGGPAQGLILRCASRMLVANNTFDDLDRFVFDVTAKDQPLAGPVDGLRIANNIAVSRADKVFSIDSALPSSVRIDRNLAYNRRGGYVAYVVDRGNTRSLGEFTAWTGFERTGLSADPRFRDPRRRDYRLSRGSPAIGRGLRIRGVTPRSRGRPDLGRYPR